MPENRIYKKMKNDIFLLSEILAAGLLFRLYISKYLLPINFISILISLGTMLLIFYVVKRTINRNVALLTVFFYAICPWLAYLEAAYSPPLKFDLFDDPGLLNFVNMFQGELKESGILFFGRFIENKYIFAILHFFFSVSKQFSPAVYFTSQEKLLGFSFSPPIYFGLIIPFIFGLQTVWGYIKKNWFILILIVLLIPSIFSKDSPDLTRLSIISPLLFLTIGLGYQRLFLLKDNNFYKFLIFLSIFLSLLQILEVIIGISTSEQIRMLRLAK